MWLFCAINKDTVYHFLDFQLVVRGISTVVFLLIFIRYFCGISIWSYVANPIIGCYN